VVLDQLAVAVTYSLVAMEEIVLRGCFLFLLAVL
jgi:hypothetical protein